jgi:hypothetical protein
MMLVFPQLTTGAVGQFPIVRRRRYNAVANVLADGSQVAYADASPRTNTWDLTLRDLTDDEANHILQLFQNVEGRRGTFTFIDPTANLLAHSEDFDEACWTKGPMIQFGTGIDDPVGGSRAIRAINAGQANQSLSQSIPAPAWFEYCLSIYARSAGGSSISLTRSGAVFAQTRVFPLGPGWTRCMLSGALNSTDESVQFAIELPAGASVDLYGVQAEAQPSASAYKRTGERNGIFSKARFNDDMLRQTSDGPDQHRISLRIVAKD